MEKREIITNNSEETKWLARELLHDWIKENKDNDSNWIICLYGNLGGGKTTFTQGLAETLGVNDIVNSPTFVIMKKYNSEVMENKKYSLYHFDCYRISDQKEILNLGWEEILNGKNNIVAIEWPEKIEEILPKERLNIKFEFINEKTRKIIM